MSKTKKDVAVFGTLGVMVAVSLLVAMSIVCGKYLAFGIGEVLRFSFENLPIMLSGMLFGPVVGTVAGVAADLIGCFLVGYAVNPLVTLGAAAVGGISGLCWMLLKKTELSLGARSTISVAAAHFLGSVIIKTLGLAAFYSMPVYLLGGWRLVNYLAVGTLEAVIIYAVVKNKSVKAMLMRLGGRKQ